jgi:[ribosomal protein S5]-alanine N-acetyltransferase
LIDILGAPFSFRVIPADMDDALKSSAEKFVRNLPPPPHGSWVCLNGRSEDDEKTHTTKAERWSSMKEEDMVPARVRFTDRLRLEPIGARHAEDLWRLFQDPAVAEWYGIWTFEMAEREAACSASAWETEGVHKWMAYLRTSGVLVGRGGLSKAQIAGQERLEIGWTLLRPFWGQGYATEIGRAGVAFAFEELGVDEIFSFTETRNARSRAVMERLDFRYSQDFIFEADGVPCVLYMLNRPS